MERDKEGTLPSIGLAGAQMIILLGLKYFDFYSMVPIGTGTQNTAVNYILQSRFLLKRPLNKILFSCRKCK